MNDRKEYHNLLPFSEAGKRLLENDDYGLLIKELEKDLARLWMLLRTTPSTDPQIAKIQGELDRLDDVIGRARSWIERTTNFVQTSIQKPESLISDDYETG